MGIDPTHLPDEYRAQVLRQIAAEDMAKFDAAFAGEVYAPFDGPERVLQRDVEVFLRAAGCEYFHMPGKAAMGNKRGVADLIIWCPGGKELKIELKTKSGKLSPAQADWKKRMEELGHTVHLARSLAHVKHIYYTEVYGADAAN